MAGINCVAEVRYRRGNGRWPSPTVRHGEGGTARRVLELTPLSRSSAIAARSAASRCARAGRPNKGSGYAGWRFAPTPSLRQVRSVRRTATDCAAHQFSLTGKRFRRSAVAFRLVLLCDRIVTLCGTGLRAGHRYKPPRPVKCLHDRRTRSPGAVSLARASHEQIPTEGRSPTKQIIGKCSATSYLWRKQGAATSGDGAGSTGDRHDTIATTHGIVRDERGQSSPDKERAQRVSRVDRGGDPPGKKEKKGEAVPSVRRQLPDWSISA